MSAEVPINPPLRDCFGPPKQEYNFWHTNYLTFTPPILVKRLDENVMLPELGSSGSAGYDLRSNQDGYLGVGDRAVVPTGLAVQIPVGYAGFIQPRSGLAAKHGITVLNTPGLIDSDYRGELKVILYNASKYEYYEVKKGDKIAQLVIQKVETPGIFEVDELDATVRGEGGFGSTGKN